jgi:hypothetical protein
MRAPRQCSTWMTLTLAPGLAPPSRTTGREFLGGPEAKERAPNPEGLGALSFAFSCR